MDIGNSLTSLKNVALKGNESDLLIAEGGWDFEGVSFLFLLYHLVIGGTCIIFKWIGRIWLRGASRIFGTTYINICITYTSYMLVQEHIDIHKYAKRGITTILQTDFSLTSYYETFRTKKCGKNFTMNVHHLDFVNFLFYYTWLYHISVHPSSHLM